MTRISAEPSANWLTCFLIHKERTLRVESLISHQKIHIHSWIQNAKVQELSAKRFK